VPRVIAMTEPAIRPAVLIGKDTRISGYMLEAALEAGLCRRRRGRDALRADADAGRGLPYPGPAPAGRRGDLGLAQSRIDDNGIKFFSARKVCQAPRRRRA
jgi:phosphoglucosamine mutase